MLFSKIENILKDYKMVIFMVAIGFGWLIMWFLFVTFAIISL